MLDPRIYAYCEEDITNISGFDRSELVSAEEGRFVMHAHPGPDCGNNIGSVHGGFLLALADTAGTGAIDTLGRENATMSVNSNFLRPAYTTDEYLEVVGTVLKRGKRVVVAEVTISVICPMYRRFPPSTPACCAMAVASAERAERLAWSQ